MSADLLAQVQAFTQAHGGKIRTGPQPRKPQGYPQASGEGYSQALAGGSALAPSRAQAHAHAPTGTRESAREAHGENPACIGRSQPIPSRPLSDPYIDYTDDFTLWSRVTRGE